MERLLEIARKKADRVEVFSQAKSSDLVRFWNGKLKEVDSSILSGVGLTVMKDGRLGTAYTRNLIDREELLRNALFALAGGVEADYALAGAAAPAALDTFDPKIESVDCEALVEESSRLIDTLAPRTEGQVNTAATRAVTTVRVLTSDGFDNTARSSSYGAHLAVSYPGSYASIQKMTSAKSLVPFSRRDLDYVIETFDCSQKEVNPRSGPTKALFLPSCVYALVWRLIAATDGRTIYEKVSPLRDRVGQRVISPSLTLEDRPLDDAQPEARSFDDEGALCENRKIFDRGVLGGFYTDRYYAKKLGAEPTGNGWRGDITSRPSPGLEHLSIEPGKEPLGSLVKKMGRGVIVAGLLGAHSGNILNGDYSIGLSPGLWVEDGEIVGRVKDSMVAGNVYEDLNRVIGVGEDLEPASMGRFPAILIDDVSFSTRG